MFGNITSLSEFCRKYKMNEKQKTELITMQAFYQGVAMVIGGVFGIVAGYVLFVVM